MFRKLIYYINIRHEIEDFEIIHNEIEKGIVFKGTNLWVLVFAIIVASVGLNTNSTAVIIGAMLISPLMGPINGIGYSIATYNFELFRSSIKNFSFAVAASLLASTIYFSLSPVSTAHSELLARTSPTIYDVLIALFGGLAGIVAISSKLKGNVIPGVAIATALMPPLCTAGFGLASGHINYFLGAFYLFTINTVFIALASLTVSQILKFPIRASIDASKKKRINRIVSVIIFITIVPSIYFGYGLVQNEKFSDNAIRYTKNITFFEGSFLLKNEIDAGKKQIKLIYGGNSLTEKKKAEIIEKAKDFNLKKAQITIEQGFTINENDENEVLKTKVAELNAAYKSALLTIDSLQNRPLLGKQILNEINALYPQITACSYSETIFFDTENEKVKRIPLLIFKTSYENKLEGNEKEKVFKWLSNRLKNKSVIIYYDEFNENI